MTRLSEWLDLMLGEIARKRDDAAAERAEAERRDAEGERRAPDPDR